MRDFKHIWPELGELAADLNRPYATVGSWMQRGIPAKHFESIISAAKLRGAEISADDLVELNAGIKRERSCLRTDVAEGAA